MRGQDWAECMLDLLHHDGLNLRPLIHLASEENLERQFTEPWVMIASDAEASNPEWDSATHPRSYGSFVRVLAEYVRERKLLTLEDAIRRMTSFPAQTLQIEGRGLLRPGYFADLVLFDPQTVQDHASYARPHQLATGIGGVWVNGVRVIEEGQHTGALPGRAIWGPGKENA